MRAHVSVRFAAPLVVALALVAGEHLFAQSPAAPAESPSALLARLDDQRRVTDFTFVMQMTSFDGDKQVEADTIWGFVKGVGAGNRSLVSFAAPASVKGRKLLMDGPVVYLLFPRTTNPIRLSPLQVLLGQASNGDVVRTAFSSDYDVASLADDTRGGVPCYRFTLTVKPARTDASYRQVVLWADKEHLRPVYAEFSTGDKLLKQATYSDYRAVLGREIPFSVDIHDAENPQKHTVMTYLKVGQKPMADTVFRREYLPSWVPEQPR
ncbi:MAG TPA: outer membrane lipoprotein-sorting protein [Spirochaetia bacterium]|nr:outer membrane lipoprotein-sorting protein [Spirochaetia bacterium]